MAREIERKKGVEKEVALIILTLGTEKGDDGRRH